MNKIVFDLQRFDNISNSANNSLVYGTPSDDYIYNNGEHVTIYASRGNDAVSLSNNGDNYVYVDAGSGNDVINAVYFYDSTIIGGAGNDSIIGEAWQANSINGGDDGDLISITGEGYYGNTIEGGAGNDSLYSELRNSKINGGEGDDLIYIYYYGNDINGGTGKDTINIYYSTNSINGGEDDDYISLTSDATLSTVYGGAGDDTIKISSTDNLIQYAGDGKDVVQGFGDTDTLQIFGDNVLSKISVSGNDVYIYSGNDYITMKDKAKSTVNVKLNNGTANISENGNRVNILGSNNTISGGADNDTIFVNSSSGSINGKAGDDYISLSARAGSNTIVGGGGNDTIILNSMNNVIQYDKGNVVILGISNADTLQINGTIKKAGCYGADVIIYVGNNYITLKDRAELPLKIQAGGVSGIDTIFSEEIDAPPKEDTNTNSNSKSNTIFSGTANNDTMTNSGTKVTINGNAGNDIITNSGANVIINGGAGNDTINNSGANVTINGGAGNDKISLSSAASGNLIQYASGEGNDSVYGFDTNDTLQITGSKYSTEKSGSDLVVSVGSGSVILKNAADTSINIKGTLAGGTSTGGGGGTDTGSGGGDDTTPAGWKFTSTLATATLAKADDLDLTDTNIKNVNASITSGGVEIIGNALNNSLKGGKGADTIHGGAGNDTVSLGAGNDVYIYSGGNDLIQDYTAGQDTIKFETEIENASVNGTNLIITTGEGKVTIKGGKGKNISVIDSNDETLTIVDEYPVEEITLPEGWKYGTAAKTNTNAEIITATLKTAENIDLTENYGEGVVSVNASISAGGIEIIGNDLNNSIRGSKGADEISGGSGNDTVSLGAGDDVYIYSGGNDVIQDYVAGHDSIKIDIDDVENISIETVGSDVVYTTSEGQIKVVKGSGKDITLMDVHGDIITFETVTLPSGWKLDSTKKLLSASVASADNEIDLNEDYGEGIEKIDATKITAGVQIFGNDLANSIKGSKGADVISGGYGNDTVSLGAGDDVYIYQGGDDYIADYVAGHDSIQIELDNVDDISVVTLGANVVYTTYEGTLTVAKGSGKDITLMDVNGDIITPGGVVIPNGWQLDSSKKILKATVASADNEIDLTEIYGDGVTKVDASKMSSGVSIIGNDLNNSLKGGKGDDFLDGGSGNDTLTGGTGEDVFIYSGGDDYITDYTAGKDSIQIDTSEIEISGVETLGANVVYSTDAGNITVKSGANKKITLMDADGEEIVIKSDTFPRGWKIDSSKNLLQATIASAENEIDLTEVYGDGVQKVDGSKITGGVVIIGNDLDNSLKGGKGADEISGGSGNDTVSLGGGEDVYIYSGGDDVIQDYVAGTDSIKINTGDIEVTGLSTVGNDIIYETSAGTIKVVKGKGKDITLMDENGGIVKLDGKILPEGWKYLNSFKTVINATLSTAKNVDLTQEYGNGVKNVNASITSNGVEIIGNDLNNSIKGGKGADTIYGGAGNDTVSLGGGADVYIYSGGNDLVQDYANVDSIYLDKDEINISKTKGSVSGSNYIIKTDKGNLTLKGAASKTINLFDTSGKAISLSTTSKNVAENIWFLEDDNNFVASDIDSITENKFAVTEIQDTKTDELSQPVLTFAKEK